MLVMVLLERHQLRRPRRRRCFFVAALAPFLVDRRRRTGDCADRASRPHVEPDGPSHVRQGGADRRARLRQGYGGQAAEMPIRCGPRSTGIWRTTTRRFERSSRLRRAISAPCCRSTTKRACRAAASIDRATLMPDLDEAGANEDAGERRERAHRARADRVPRLAGVELSARCGRSIAYGIPIAPSA